MVFREYPSKKCSLILNEFLNIFGKRQRYLETSRFTRSVADQWLCEGSPRKSSVPALDQL